MLTVSNSSLRLGAGSYAPDDPGMQTYKTLTSIKEVRRDRLRLLWDTVGGTELARLTEIDKAYLYQMAMGKGANARGVSDENAELIEAAVKKPKGWLSAQEDRVDESPETYAESPQYMDRELLRNAIIHVEHKLNALNKKSAGLRADIILGVYDMLLTGCSEEAVAGFLSGIQFAPPQRTK